MPALIKRDLVEQLIGRAASDAAITEYRLDGGGLARSHRRQRAV